MFGLPEDGSYPRIRMHAGLRIGGSTGMAAGCWSKDTGAKVPGLGAVQGYTGSDLRQIGKECLLQNCLDQSWSMLVHGFAEASDEFLDCGSAVTGHSCPSASFTQSSCGRVRSIISLAFGPISPAPVLRVSISRIR